MGTADELKLLPDGVQPAALVFAAGRKADLVMG